jgi:hypothetical protein
MKFDIRLSPLPSARPFPPVRAHEGQNTKPCVNLRYAETGRRARFSYDDLLILFSC